MVCATYRKKGKHICTSHQIRNVVIEELLLDDLQRVTTFAREHENEMSVIQYTITYKFFSVFIYSPNSRRHIRKDVFCLGFNFTCTASSFLLSVSFIHSII